MAGITIQPFKTSGSLTNLFNVESRGLTQGDAQDDPAVRLQLASGMIDPTLSTSLYGGLGVTECIPTDAVSVAGAMITKATADVCNAFTVFNQAYHGVTTPSSPVPQYIAGGSVHYYRIGSSARIPLPVSAAVAALASSGTTAVGADGFVWDVTNNVVDVYVEPASGDDSTNPKVNIKLLMISTTGNLTVVKDADGNFTWETTKPCGLFLI